MIIYKFLSGEKRQSIENLYKEIIERTYYPSVPEYYIAQEKRNGIPRIIPVFSIKDYCLYYYCIKKLEKKIAYNRIKNTFGGWTLGGLFRESEDDEIQVRKKDFDKYEDTLAGIYGISVSEYSFNPKGWSKAFGDFNSKLYATASITDCKYVAELDITNFYDNIRLDILENQIREVAEKEHSEVVSLLFHFLHYWNRKSNFYNKQSVGLPQDAMSDCSRILANFYLQGYDEFVYKRCESLDSVYLRYADDHFIFSNSKSQIYDLIFHLSVHLNALGLSLNPHKVHVGKTEDLIHYRSFEIFNILKEQEDKSNSEKVNLFAQKVVDLFESNTSHEIKDRGYPLLNKLLTCTVLNEIKIANKYRIISYCLNDEYLKHRNTKHWQFGKIYDLLQGKEKEEFIKKLLGIANDYTFNSFHYNLLAFFKKYNVDTDALLKIMSNISVKADL